MADQATEERELRILKVEVRDMARSALHHLERGISGWTMPEKGAPIPMEKRTRERYYEDAKEWLQRIVERCL